MTEAEAAALNETAFASLRAFNHALDLAFGAAAPARELEVAPVNCRFYGRAAIVGRLVDTHGNQCALIFDRHAPCQMEIAGETPDEKTCPMVMRIFGSAGVQKNGRDERKR